MSLRYEQFAVKLNHGVFPPCTSTSICLYICTYIYKIQFLLNWLHLALPHAISNLCADVTYFVFVQIGALLKDVDSIGPSYINFFYFL